MNKPTNIVPQAFRMYSIIRFNRPIVDTDYISPGGYEFATPNKTISFDFEEYAGWIDEKDQTLLHTMQKIRITTALKIWSILQSTIC